MVDIWKNNRESVVDLEKQKEAWGNQEINGIASTDSPMDTGSSQPPVNAVASPPARVTRSSSRRSASQTPIEVEAPIQIAEEAEPLVDCNTCNRKVPLTHLPQHWNLCEQGKPDPKLDQLTLEKASQSPAEKRQVEFGNQSSPSSSSSGTLKRKVNLGPKPGKIVYSMHSLTQLRKIMRELGLPDSGDHKVLVKRHKEYITLYNANIDSTNPVDAKVLRKRLIQREEILANDAGPAVKVDESNMEEHKRKYSPQFDSLISDAMKRRKKLEEAEQKAKESSKASKSAENNSAPQEAAAGASTATSSEYLDGITWDLLDDDDFMP